MCSPELTICCCAFKILYIPYPIDASDAKVIAKIAYARFLSSGMIIVVCSVGVVKRE